jgi:hypothetical protein
MRQGRNCRSGLNLSAFLDESLRRPRAEHTLNVAALRRELRHRLSLVSVGFQLS